MTAAAVTTITAAEAERSSRRVADQKPAPAKAASATAASATRFVGRSPVSTGSHGRRGAPARAPPAPLTPRSSVVVTSASGRAARAALQAVYMLARAGRPRELLLPEDIAPHPASALLSARS